MVSFTHRSYRMMDPAAAGQGADRPSADCIVQEIVRNSQSNLLDFIWQALGGDNGRGNSSIAIIEYRAMP
jgi:hypothetical protein